MRISTFVILAGLWTSFSARSQTITFDFDTGAPVFATGQPAPLDQTVGGVTATFAGAFSIQTDFTTGLRMSQFSGKYLYPNNQNRNILNIKFNRQVTGITLLFATADFQQVEVPTTMQLNAFLDTNATPVGSVSAHGTYGTDSMPVGRLSFTSPTRPFNMVEISVAPNQPLGASAFLVDNVAVTLDARPAFVNVSAASYASGSLAPGSIVSAFGQGMASATDSAQSLPLPTTLANAVVTVTDSAGVTRSAGLLYVSPTQINYVLPDNFAPGSAVVAVTSAGQVTATASVTAGLVCPGLFTANFDGKGAPAGAAVTVAPDLTQTFQPLAACGTAPGSCVTVPVVVGSPGSQVILTLYGTGIRGRSSLAAVVATIGGVIAQVQYAGMQSQYPGLDQVNVAVPTSLAGRGEVDLLLTVEGVAANLVRVNIK